MHLKQRGRGVRGPLRFEADHLPEKQEVGCFQCPIDEPPAQFLDKSVVKTVARGSSTFNKGKEEQPTNY